MWTQGKYLDSCEHFERSQPGLYILDSIAPTPAVLGRHYGFLSPLWEKCNYISVFALQSPSSRVSNSSPCNKLSLRTDSEMTTMTIVTDIPMSVLSSYCGFAVYWSNYVLFASGDEEGPTWRTEVSHRWPFQ